MTKGFITGEKMKIKLISVILAALLSLFCFAACSSEGMPDVQVPAGCRLAYSDVLDYYFAYPATVWFAGSTESGYLSVVKGSGGEDMSSVVVNSWEVEVPVGAKDYWEGINNEKPELEDGVAITDPENTYGGYEYTLSQLVEGYTVVEAKEETVCGYDAYRVTYEGKIAGSDYRIMQLTIARIQGNKTIIYEFTYTSTPEFFEENLESVETMISSFGVKE